MGGSHLSRYDGNRYGDRDQYRRGGDRDGFERPPRPEIPIPDKPPFNAFVGNLSWEVGNSELEEFFGATHILSIRMISDNATGKPKGYGYVEFDDRDSLIAAIDKSGREVGGRPIRISVAEPPKERDDRTGGAWRREGPPPSFDDNRRSRYPSHHDQSAADEVDRGERMGFGSKFVPSTDNVTNMTRRSNSGRGFSRNEGGGGFDGETADRGDRMGFGKYVPSVEPARKEREPPQRGSNFVPSRVTPVGSDDGHSASGGCLRKAIVLERKSTDVEPTAADTVSNWRRAKPLTPDPEVAPQAPPTATPTAPPTRRKLELSARTITSSEGTLTPPVSVVSNKPSPFGAAKPVDSTEREKAIQERLDRERAESAAANSKNPPSVDGKSASEVDPKGTSVTTPAPPPPAPKVAKPNPFGAAKPVDTLQKELEVEKKLEKEKALLEEKLKKEADIKPPPPVSFKGAVNSPSQTSLPSSAATNPTPSNSPYHPSTRQPSPPRSRWRTASTHGSTPAANGNAPPSSSSAPVPAAPAPKSVISPKSPSLSSFRKEGVSFAALAKTAASSPQAPSVVSTGPKPAGKDEPRLKPVGASQPTTILKRVEGLEIQKE